MNDDNFRPLELTGNITDGCVNGTTLNTQNNRPCNPLRFSSVVIGFTFYFPF